MSYYSSVKLQTDYKIIDLQSEINTLRDTVIELENTIRLLECKHNDVLEQIDELSNMVRWSPYINGNEYMNHRKKVKEGGKFIHEDDIIVSGYAQKY